MRFQSLSSHRFSDVKAGNQRSHSMNENFTEIPVEKNQWKKRVVRNAWWQKPAELGRNVTCSGKVYTQISRGNLVQQNNVVPMAYHVELMLF